MKTCCICGQPFNGYGNNPAPIAPHGVCCDVCNIKLVVPRRLLDAKKAKICKDADALTSTPLQRAESAKLNAFIGQTVEIEYTDGDVDIGVLHKDTPAIRYQNIDGDNTTVCGYYIERADGDGGSHHFKKSHVKTIRAAAITAPTREQINELVGKSVFIEFNDGVGVAGFLHQTIISAGDGKKYLVRYYLETPPRRIYFSNTDVKTIREA